MKVNTVNFIKKRLLHRCFPVKNTYFLWTHYFQNTSGLWQNSFYDMFYSMKTGLRYNKISSEEGNEKLATQSRIFNHQAYFMKTSIFTGNKKRGWDCFHQSISDRTFKTLYRWKSTLTRDGAENSSKKGQKQTGERSIDKRITAKEKVAKSFFLIAYFHLRFRIYAITYISITQVDKGKEKGKRTVATRKLKET